MVYLKPFTNRFSFSDNDASITANLSLSKDGESTIFNAGGTANYLNRTSEDIKNIEAFAQYRDLKADINVDIAGYNRDNSDDEAYLNNRYMKIELKNAKNNSRIGRIFWEADEYGYAVAMMRYSDGSTEPLSAFMSPVNEDMEGFFSEDDSEFFRRKAKLKRSR
ncbi:MAG: hypothetical protein ACK4ND_00960 [Cytophagaceae bacterium]